jgi:murein DD-endopeptidase MepM/ murein hydrolase activator NlpD
MARSLRATLLLTALGVAAPVLAPSAAAANTGGAAPGSVVAISSSSEAGGAAPGVEPAPAQRATSSRTGGALAGHKPKRRRTAPRRPAKVTPRVKRVEPAPVVLPVEGVFPLVGTYSFGGEDARFGADRPGHIHQGQDVIAARGTPILSPVAGSVWWKANQPEGAGIYLVVRGARVSRDYVFMHIKRGTVLVKVGDPVTAGQQLAQVGSTGSSSGPHLHFEIWVDGWGEKDGAPIDPLPQLQTWAGLPVGP